MLRAMSHMPNIPCHRAEFVSTFDSERDCVMPLRKRTAQLTVFRFYYGQDRVTRFSLLVNGRYCRFKEKCWL